MNGYTSWAMYRKSIFIIKEDRGSVQDEAWIREKHSVLERYRFKLRNKIKQNERRGKFTV